MEQSLIESKINTLRERWKGRVPKSHADLNWWKFNCDKILCHRYLIMLEEIKKGKDLEKTAAALFGGQFDPVS